MKKLYLFFGNLLAFCGAAAIAYVFCGCAGTLEQPAVPVADVVYCRRVDRAQATWGAIGKGAATLAGGGGLAVLPIDQEEKGLRISVAGAALAFAAFSVGALYAHDGYAETWARDCSPKPVAAVR